MIGSLIMRYWRRSLGGYPPRIFLSTLAFRSLVRERAELDFFGIPLVIDHHLKGISGYCVTEPTSEPEFVTR